MHETAKRQRPPVWKFALLGLVVLAVAAGGFAAARALDWRADRQRPMYHDVLLMAGLQYDLLDSGQEGIELSIDSDSEPVRVGEVSFQPLPGVEIVVELREDAYCVRGRNQYGDETHWECVDGTGDRPDMGVLDKEF